MIVQEVLDRIETELAQAEAARSSGLEGRARVSARRAAGMAVRAFLQARGDEVGSASVIDLLQLLRDQPETPDDLRKVLEHLLARVNQDFELPHTVDLISETRWLVQTLNKG
jgi:hypothetical protein